MYLNRWHERRRVTRTKELDYKCTYTLATLFRPIYKSGSTPDRTSWRDGEVFEMTFLVKFFTSAQFFDARNIENGSPTYRVNMSENGSPLSPSFSTTALKRLQTESMELQY